MSDKRPPIIAPLYCQRSVPVLGLLLFSGRGSPLGWHNPDRGFINRRWSVNSADHGTVIRAWAGTAHVIG